MSPEAKQILRDLRLKFQDRAEKEYDHAKTLFPGTPRRLQQTGVAQGFERAAKLVEEQLIAAP
jgi:hypothetical protein